MSEIVAHVRILLDEVERLTYERDQYRAESQRLGNQAQHLVNRVTAERERANEAARLSAAARDANDDLLKQVEAAHEKVGIVEEGRLDLIVENRRLEHERDQARAELAAMEQDRDRLRTVVEARRERDLAIAHDRQPYPTAWAYEQASKTIERMRPVVKEALAWRNAESASPYLDASDADRDLIAVVDAYESEMEALAATVRRGEEGADDHPERVCRRCGGPNVKAWCAPSPLWNQVMRGGDINAPDAFDGIVCPVCFAQLAEQAGVAYRWRFYAERVLVPLATVTPSGRVWNEQTWLWDERPVESEPCPDLGKAVSDEDTLDPAAPPIGAVLHALGDIILDPGEYRSSTCPYCFDPASTPEHRERCQP